MIKYPKLDGPLSISWDVTNSCNFRCMHCFNRSGDSSYHNLTSKLTFDQVNYICDKVIEVHPDIVCLCGGEPTLCNHFLHIVKKLSSNHISVNTVSNGYFIDADYAKQMKEAGIAVVQISLDSYIEAEHDKFRNCSGAFTHAVNAIKSLLSEGIYTEVSACPTKFNYNKIFEYANFIEKLGVKKIRMMPFVPMGRGLDNFNKLTCNEAEYFILKNQIIKFNSLSKKAKIEWGDPLEHIYKAVYKNQIQPTLIEIKSNGDIGISPYLPVTLGNIFRHSIIEYWSAGLNEVWGKSEVLELISKINTLTDFFNEELMTWTIKRKDFDLVDE